MENKIFKNDEHKKEDFLVNPILMVLGFITFLTGFLVLVYLNKGKEWDSAIWTMLLLTVLFIPSKKFNTWLRKQYESVVETVGNLLVSLFYLVVVIFVLWLGYKGVVWGYNLVRPKSWTLFIYSSATPDTDYQINRIDGYSRQSECLEAGIKYSLKTGSYECGYDCRYRDKYYMEICDRVCGKSGCRD